MNQRSEEELAESFPFPKMFRTFNYFFPKAEGAPDLFTMENFKKYYRFAPLGTWVILALIFAMWVRDGFMMNEDAWAFYFCFMADSAFFIIAFIHHVWWLGGAVVAKIVRRSPMVPLWMSFFDPLRYFVGFCFIQVLGFMGRILGSLVL